MPWWWVDTNWSISQAHQLLHTPSTASPQDQQFSTPRQSLISYLSSGSKPWHTQLSTLPRIRVDQYIESQLLLCIPYDPLPADGQPPSTPTLLNCRPRVNLQICAGMAFLSAQSWPPSASLYSHNNGLHRQSWVHSTSGFKCNSKLS